MKDFLNGLGVLLASIVGAATVTAVGILAIGGLNWLVRWVL